MPLATTPVTRGCYNLMCFYVTAAPVVATTWCAAMWLLLQWLLQPQMLPCDCCSRVCLLQPQMLLCDCCSRDCYNLRCCYVTAAPVFATTSDAAMWLLLPWLLQPQILLCDCCSRGSTPSGAALCDCCSRGWYTLRRSYVTAAPMAATP